MKKPADPDLRGSRCSPEITRVIPSGWTWEPAWARQNALWMLQTDGAHGLMATVDFACRAFYSGLTDHGSRASTATYTGRNWRVRLVEDAVAYLKAIEAS